jgi:uracil-DNA glycosylase family 4
MKENEFTKLKEEILNCRKCEDKFGFQPHPIIFGNQKSKIFQISQAPSKNVHETLKPFNDHSGRKLRNEWYKIDDDCFYNQSNFYISAIAHCYPGKSTNGGDRLPPKICTKTWIEREIELVDNKLFILIGAKAAKYFFPDEQFTDLVFKNNEINAKAAIVLPHPSPLNIKWYKDNPGFYAYRLEEIRNMIHEVLFLG